VELGYLSTADSCVYKASTRTNVRAPRNVLYGWKHVFVGLEDPTPVTMKIIVFWDETVCMYSGSILPDLKLMVCFHLQSRRIMCCPCITCTAKKTWIQLDHQSPIITRQSSLVLSPIWLHLYIVSLGIVLRSLLQLVCTSSLVQEVSLLIP
jgi:hypothetical protein